MLPVRPTALLVRVDALEELGVRAQPAVEHARDATHVLQDLLQQLAARLSGDRQVEFRVELAPGLVLGRSPLGAVDDLRAAIDKRPEPGLDRA